MRGEGEGPECLLSHVCRAPGSSSVSVNCSLQTLSHLDPSHYPRYRQHSPQLTDGRLLKNTRGGVFKVKTGTTAYKRNRIRPAVKWSCRTWLTGITKILHKVLLIVQRELESSLKVLGGQCRCGPWWGLVEFGLNKHGANKGEMYTQGILHVFTQCSFT